MKIIENDNCNLHKECPYIINLLIKQNTKNNMNKIGVRNVIICPEIMKKISEELDKKRMRNQQVEKMKVTQKEVMIISNKSAERYMDSNVYSKRQVNPHPRINLNRRNSYVKIKCACCKRRIAKGNHFFILVEDKTNRNNFSPIIIHSKCKTKMKNKIDNIIENNKEAIVSGKI